MPDVLSKSWRKIMGAPLLTSNLPDYPNSMDQVSPTSLKSTVPVASTLAYERRRAKAKKP